MPLLTSGPFWGRHIVFVLSLLGKTHCFRLVPSGEDIVFVLSLLGKTHCFRLVPSGEDTLFSSCPFWGRHIVFVLSVCHKSLYVQLLHFKRKFLKTLHACLLIKDTRPN